MRYVQLTSDLYLSYRSSTTPPLFVVKHTILPVIGSTTGPVQYYVVKPEIITVRYGVHQFEISEGYRWLNAEESSLYKQEVIITQKVTVYPTEEFIKTGHYKEKHLHCGEVHQILGFSYDSHDKEYVPFIKIGNIHYELHDLMFVSKILIESLFDNIVTQAVFWLDDD